MTLHTNVITRLAVLLLLLGVVMAIGTPQVWAHHGPNHGGSTFINFNTYQPLMSAILATKGLSLLQQQLTFEWVRENFSGHLDLSNTGINSVVGLEAFVNVTSMDLSGNNITNFNSFSGLTSTTGLPVNLKRLDLDGNSMTDISGLSGLTALKVLGLSNNNIANVNALSSLTNLTHLDLGGNQLADTVTRTRSTVNEETVIIRADPELSASVLYPLRGLTNLERLDISNNNIGSIEALAGLTKLKVLRLQENNIGNVGPLVNDALLLPSDPATGLPAGAKVWLEGNPTGDSGAYARLTDGTEEFTGFSVLDVYLNILIAQQGVTVYGARHTDAVRAMFDDDDPTDGHPAAEVAFIPDDSLRALLRESILAIGPTDVPNPQPILESLRTSKLVTKGHLVSLRKLDARYKEPYWRDISSLRGLEHCKNLEVLVLNNQASLGTVDWAILWYLTKLKALGLSNVGLEAGEGRPVLSFLENMRELTHLDLSRNWLRDISPIGKLTQLVALDLRNNDIEALTGGMENLANLEVLYLDTNFLHARRPLGAVERAKDYLPNQNYYDPGPSDNAYFMPVVLQALANRPNLRLRSDMPIIKSVAFEEPEFAYGQGGLVHVTVTFNSAVGYKSSKAAFRNGRPYLTLSVGGNIPLDAEGNPFHTADWVEDGSAVHYWITHPSVQPPEPIDPNTGEPFREPYKEDPDGRYVRDAEDNRVLINPYHYFADLKKPLPHEQFVDLGDTLKFAYFLPPGIPASSLRVEALSASPLIHFGPEIPIINLTPSKSPDPSDGEPLPGVNLIRSDSRYFLLDRVEGQTQIAEDSDGNLRVGFYEYRHQYRENDWPRAPSAQKAYRLGRAWFRFLTEPTKPVVTSATVALRRADGETGEVTDDFDVSLTFSGPLSEASAAALADHISFGDAAGVSIGSLTRPGRSPAYAPETWTLSVSVTGANGDITVTLDPEGLTDAANPGNPIATEGSTLSVTVPVSSPPLFTPKTEPYVFGEALEMSILFAEDGVTYEGDVPPYITIYLGERVQANERHAKWARAEDANSTLVTFAYEIGAGDVAQSVSIKSEAGVAVPKGATVVLGEERVVGTAPPPAESGVAPPPTQQPASGGGGAADPGGTQRTVISLGTPSARVTVTEIPVQIVGTVWFPETPTDRETPGASSVPRTPIVFNELGNGSGDTNDWLEFRNVTGSAVSLKDWTLSVVQDDKKEDTSLIAFPDVSVPANGLLLIVNTSPDKTPLARGDDIESSGKNGGSAQPYLVNAGLSLPDDGKFLLILRNAKDKLGKNEAFIDVAGGGGSDTDAFVRNQEGDYDTYVWPLQVGEAPGGNTEEALGSGKVWQRAKADIVGYHKDAWAEAAFTGLGYDRKVTESAATAGTPGYPNGAVKTAASTPKGSVTFSEIMVDSGGGKLPQWIELYNNSKTEVLNLNRWELEIQNVDSEDLVGRPIVTLTLQEKLIQPNQTLLIVSGDARASSSARLPADRVYNLFELHEKNLRIKKPHDTFLSAEGFYLKLTDRNGATIDEVGNTDGNRRTNDAPYWALSMSREEGVRSSLIRRYTKGKSEAKDGMASGNWVLAANVKGFVADGEELHWGHAEDIGSPGYRKGGPLPVELSSFSVKRTEKGAVVLSWTTESEVDNAGFNLRRSEKRASGFTLINPALIAGAGTTGERQTYTFTDTSAKPGIEYYYQIEEVSFDGKSVPLVTRMLPGPVSASNRALTTFGELKRQRQE